MREHEIITNEILRSEWTRVLSTYYTFIKNGLKLGPIRFAIRHVIEQGYDKIWFSGTPMYSLLISTPTNGRINFNKTLRISLPLLKRFILEHPEFTTQLSDRST